MAAEAALAEAHASDLAQRLEMAERARAQLADVAGATEALRYVDFDAGEEVVVSDEIRGHALWSSMRETIRERNEERSRRYEAIADLDRIQRQVGPELTRLRARVAALETAFLDACREKIVHSHTTTLLVTAKQLEIPGIEELCVDADQIRSEAKTLVNELATVLESIVCHWYADVEGKTHQDLIDAASAALAKAKGGTT